LHRCWIWSKKNNSPHRWGKTHPRNSENKTVIGQEDEKNQGTTALVLGGMGKNNHLGRRRSSIAVADTSKQIWREIQRRRTNLLNQM
jgi:hypothetical protein